MIKHLENRPHKTQSRKKNAEGRHDNWQNIQGDLTKGTVSNKSCIVFFDWQIVGVLETTEETLL